MNTAPRGSRVEALHAGSRLIGGAILSLLFAPAVMGDVVGFDTTGSGSVGVSATLYDPNGDGESADAFTGVTPDWNGLGPFDRTSQQQASVGGETLTVTTRLQLDATTDNGLTTMAYRERNSMSLSSGIDDPYRDIGWSYDRSISINFTTTGWTKLDFSNIGGGLDSGFEFNELQLNSGGGLYGIDDSSGSAVVDWSMPIITAGSGQSLMNLGGWAEEGSSLLLGAGSWTLELRDSISGPGEFDDSLDFDMEFSNFVVPGPIPFAGLLGFAAIRRGRRR